MSAAGKLKKTVRTCLGSAGLQYVDDLMGGLHLKLNELRPTQIHHLGLLLRRQFPGAGGDSLKVERVLIEQSASPPLPAHSLSQALTELLGRIVGPAAADICAHYIRPGEVLSTEQFEALATELENHLASVVDTETMAHFRDGIMLFCGRDPFSGQQLRLDLTVSPGLLPAMLEECLRRVVGPAAFAILDEARADRPAGRDRTEEILMLALNCALKIQQQLDDAIAGSFAEEFFEATGVNLWDPNLYARFVRRRTDPPLDSRLTQELTPPSHQASPWSPQDSLRTRVAGDEHYETYDSNYETHHETQYATPYEAHYETHYEPVPTPSTIPSPPGTHFLFYGDDVQRALNQFTYLSDDRPGLVLTLTYPPRFRTIYQMPEVTHVRWVTQDPEGYADYLDPRTLPLDAHNLVLNFLGQGGGAIFIDGYVQLKLANGFHDLIGFLKDVKDQCSMAGVSMVMIVEDSGLQGHERTLLERDFDIKVRGAAY